MELARLAAKFVTNTDEHLQRVQTRVFVYVSLVLLNKRCFSFWEKLYSEPHRDPGFKKNNA